MLLNGQLGYCYEHDEEGRLVLVYGNGVLHPYRYDDQGGARLITRRLSRGGACLGYVHTYPSEVALAYNFSLVFGEDGMLHEAPLPYESVRSIIPLFT